MKRYLIITSCGREVLTTSPTLLTDYKDALHSLRKSVVTQLNKLNGLHLKLSDYLEDNDYPYYLKAWIDDMFVIRTDKYLFEPDRIVQIKCITIK